MNTAQLFVIFVWAIFCTMISCSTAICALCAILLSWLTSLSPPETHSAVDSAFGKLTITLSFGLTSSGALIVSIISSLATLFIPKWRAAWRTGFAGHFVGILWVAAVVANLVLCAMSKWHPCSIMSQVQFSLRPEAIPNTIGACRKIIALDILALINLFFVAVFPLALHQMYKQSKTRPTARARSNRNKKNHNKRNIKNNKNVAEGDNEVDLSELARHLDGIDEV